MNNATLKRVVGGRSGAPYAVSGYERTAVSYTSIKRFNFPPRRSRKNCGHAFVLLRREEWSLLVRVTRVVKGEEREVNGLEVFIWLKIILNDTDRVLMEERNIIFQLYGNSSQLFWSLLSIGPQGQSRSLSLKTVHFKYRF